MTPSFYRYRVAPVFDVPDTEDERVLYKTFDLLLPPQRGQDVLLPGETEARRVARVISRPALR